MAETEKRLTRNIPDKMIGGVAAGLGRYLRIDITIVRLLFVLAAFFTGTGILVYIILWIAMPADHTVSGVEGVSPPLENPVREGSVAEKPSSNTTAVIGWILLVLGIVLLMDEFMGPWFREYFYWFSLRRIWPLAFVILGVAIIASAYRKSSPEDPFRATPPDPVPPPGSGPVPPPGSGPVPPPGSGPVPPSGSEPLRVEPAGSRPAASGIPEEGSAPSSPSTTGTSAIRPESAGMTSGPGSLAGKDPAEKRSTEIPDESTGKTSGPGSLSGAEPETPPRPVPSPDRSDKASGPGPVSSTERGDGPLAKEELLREEQTRREEQARREEQLRKDEQRSPAEPPSGSPGKTTGPGSLSGEDPLKRGDKPGPSGGPSQGA